MTTKENDSLQAMDAQQRAEFVPQQYFDVISRRADNNRMQPALIFTADNLRSIKRYVHYVLRLPKSIDEINGTHDLSLIGIDAAQVDRLYTNLRTHVETWDVLERETKSLGTRLEIFASSFITDGRTLIEKLEATEAFRTLKARLRDVVDEVSLARSGFRVLGKGERKQVADLRSHLGIIAEDIAEVRQQITAIKERAQWFADAVVRQLRPETDALNRQIKDISPEKLVDDLRQRLTPLDEEIEKMDASYQKLVGLAFTGLVFGPIGVAITGGIYGAQAEGVRAANNLLRRKRETLVQQIEAISPMVGVFETTTLQIADLKFRLTEVQTAAKNLEDVWNMLGVYVEQSGEELELIGTDIELATFMLRFERVLRPWHSIRDISSQLSKIFNETVDEISKEGTFS
ncbi:alpha-xenorhabdolysin family binary toxin subunit A [Pseudomonas putida CSV86]|uniref:Alpha-xenorhabdolysin family binary toxin subunit A n=1 Tax=Pseudomonas bharatica CSV86 TaxID=1005395 RepID=L1M0F7_9PSED|nr:alpha-xenorhabdolysin family binary toxin subunit A [Pseudomonas bharatica]NNJ14113.1 alpha-xenorhabdolysin family binary toxin subunit A [Pseudomonas bharatica CSV86]